MSGVFLCSYKSFKNFTTAHLLKLRLQRSWFIYTCSNINQFNFFSSPSNLTLLSPNLSRRCLAMQVVGPSPFLTVRTDCSHQASRAHLISVANGKCVQCLSLVPSQQGTPRSLVELCKGFLCLSVCACFPCSSSSV